MSLPLVLAIYARRQLAFRFFSGKIYRHLYSAYIPCLHCFIRFEVSNNRYKHLNARLELSVDIGRCSKIYWQNLTICLWSNILHICSSVKSSLLTHTFHHTYEIVHKTWATTKLVGWMNRSQRLCFTQYYFHICIESVTNAVYVKWARNLARFMSPICVLCIQHWVSSSLSRLSCTALWIWLIVLHVS